MPNLQPPVTTTELALEYREQILSALPAGQTFLPLMALYLTDETSPAEIARATQGLADALEAMIGEAPEQWYTFKPMWPASAAEADELAQRAAKMEMPDD